MKRAFLLLLCIICFHPFAEAQMATRVVRDSLFIPWAMVNGPNGTIWFTQKNGYICRLEPMSGQIDTLYYEANTVVNNEGGMLGMALHPDFPNQPYVYVAYEYNSGGYKERIVRYTYSSNALSSPMILLDNITGASIHNGCRLVIVNDKLFITTGDASNTSNPQNVNSLNGKVLRINLDGSIPSDNPAAGNPVWSWGHRNPQGLVYANGKLYSSEHGPSDNDEINIIQKGRNYGWPDVHGFCDQPAEMNFCNDSNVAEPLITWTPTIATSGLDYYNHPMFPQFQNSLIMGTLAAQDLYQLKLNANFDSIISATIIPFNYGRLRAVCVAPNGKIYVSTSNSSASGSGNKIDKIIEIYDSTFTTSVINIASSNEITIYPNPAGDYTIIKLATGLQQSEWEYELTDTQGRLLKKGTCTGNNITLSLQEFSRGIYLIKIIADRRVYTGRIVKH